MGKLVDQHEARAAAQNGVDIHFGEPMALIGHDPARDDFEPLKERFGLLAAMRLDDADDDIDAFGLFGLCRGQHFDRSCRRPARRQERSSGGLVRPAVLHATGRQVKAAARRCRVSPYLVSLEFFTLTQREYPTPHLKRQQLKARKNPLWKLSLLSTGRVGRLSQPFKRFLHSFT